MAHTVTTPDPDFKVPKPSGPGGTGLRTADPVPDVCGQPALSRVHRPISPWKRYGYALLSMVVATVGRLLLDQFLGVPPSVCHLLRGSAVVGMVWRAWNAGLAATGIGGVVLVALAQPMFARLGQGPGSLVGFEFYFMVCLTGVILFEAQRRAEQRSAMLAKMARDRLRQLIEETSTGPGRGDGAAGGGAPAADL